MTTIESPSPPADLPNVFPAPDEPLTLHYSGMTAWRKCPQAWQYRYVQGYRRPQGEEVPARDLGSWWHALRAADSTARAREIESAIDDGVGTIRSFPRRGIRTVDNGPAFTDPTTLCVAEVLDAASTWWAGLPPESHLVWDEAIGGDLPSRLAEMNARWEARWAKETKREHPLAVEMFWEKPLPMPDGYGGPPVRLIGFIDEVFEHDRRGVAIRDHKTHRTLSAASSFTDMMDSQLQVYAWGASDAIAALGRGDVRATAYDRARSVKPKEPSLTATGTLSKSVTDFDLATYLRWAAGPDGEGVPWGEEGAHYASGAKKGQPKFGVYRADDAVVARLSTPDALADWNDRTFTPINLNIVRAHLRSAQDAALGIAATRDAAARLGEAPRNLTDSACRWCDYASLCRAQMVGGPRGVYDLAEHGLAAR